MKTDFYDVYSYFPRLIQAPILYFALMRAEYSYTAYWRAYNLADYSQDYLSDIGLAYLNGYSVFRQYR